MKVQRRKKYRTKSISLDSAVNSLKIYYLHKLMDNIKTIISDRMNLVLMYENKSF